MVAVAPEFEDAAHEADAAGASRKPPAGTVAAGAGGHEPPHGPDGPEDRLKAFLRLAVDAPANKDNPAVRTLISTWFCMLDGGRPDQVDAFWRMHVRELERQMQEPRA